MSDIISGSKMGSYYDALVITYTHGNTAVMAARYFFFNNKSYSN